MIEEEWLPTRPASDSSRLASIAPEGREDSEGNLVITRQVEYSQAFLLLTTGFDDDSDWKRDESKELRCVV